MPALQASRLQEAPEPDSLPAVPGDEQSLAPPPDSSLVSDRTLDQVIRLTGKQSSDHAVSARIQKLSGKTWRDCKGMLYTTNKGVSKKYGVSDFKYDLQQGVITVEAKAAAKPVRWSKATSVLMAAISFAFMAQTAAEPLTRKEGQARAYWPEW